MCGVHVAQQMKDRKSTERYTNMWTSNPPQRCILGLFWNWGATAVDNRNWDRSHSVWNILDATWCKKKGQEEMRQEVIPKRLSSRRKRFRPLKNRCILGLKYLRHIHDGPLAKYHWDDALNLGESFCDAILLVSWVWQWKCFFLWNEANWHQIDALICFNWWTMSTCEI